MPIKAGIYYSESGGGQQDSPPIVLIHGAGSTHLCWPAELRRLPDWQVLALDLPGHGRSEGTGQQAIEAYAAQVINFLSSLGIYQTVLVGHSMGGAIALQAALDYPTQVSGLGLIASGAYMGMWPELMKSLSNPMLKPAAMQWLQARLFGPESSDDLVRKVMSAMEKERPGVMFGDWQACAQFDVSERIAHIHAPAWVACGSADQLVPVSSAHFLQTNLPDARLQILPGAGHMVILERPRELGEGLAAFLDERLRL